MFVASTASFAQNNDDDRLLDIGELLAEAQLTLYKMGNHRDFKNEILRQLRDAKAVFIIPNRVKGGLFVGAEGGKGLLLARADQGGWSYPAFYDMKSGSLGLQIGLETSRIMTIIMTDRGLSSLMEDRVSVGGELNAAVGTTGVGIEAGTTRNMDADFFTYAISSGAFIGVNIEGNVFTPNHDYNGLFYGDDSATPYAIVVEGKHANNSAQALRTALDQLTAIANK